MLLLATADLLLGLPANPRLSSLTGPRCNSGLIFACTQCGPLRHLKIKTACLPLQSGLFVCSPQVQNL